MVVPLSLERINALPESERGPWLEYWKRSEAARSLDQSALNAEIKAHGLEKPIPTEDYTGPGFAFDPKKPDAWYASEEGRKLAETIISYQGPDGGWNKLVDYGKGPRPPGATWFPVAHPDKPAWWVFASTFDNNTTSEQMKFLARAYRATGRDEDRKSFLKGLDFILAAQYPNGGWPQFYPLKHVYSDGITYNDGAMTHMMELLRDIAAGAPDYAFVDAPRRQQAKVAVDKGLDIILKTQVVRDGKPTVWGAQHDPLTLKVAGARRQEPPALSGGESALIVRYLMQIENPSPEVVRAIEGALEWFRVSSVTGLNQTKREGITYFESAPGSQTQWWARFYDVDTEKPIFSGHDDGIVYDSFEEMWNAGNRDSYDFYTQLPARVLQRLEPKWRKMISKETQSNEQY